MTYLVGLKCGNQSCIVADTAVTVEAGRSILLGAVKTGQVFPGCIYALSGKDARAAQRFVSDCKDALSDRNNLGQSWTEFERFIKTYDYAAGEDFEAIICSRSSGTSRLFRFSPKQGLVESDDMFTVGNGKQLLDEALDNYLPLLRDVIIRGPKDYPAALVAGVSLSLFLTQRSQGDEFSSLEQAGVGGVFHFTFQTAESDCLQPPTVFILTRRFGAEQIHYWAFRIAWVRRALVVHNASNRTVASLIDMLAMPEFATLTQRELEFYSEDVCREALEYPVHELLGIASADRETRFVSFLSMGPNPEVDWSFNLSETIERVITRLYDLRLDELGENSVVITAKTAGVES